MIEALFLAAILSVTDPAGDTHGDGSLRAPTDVVFRTPGVFDVETFDVHDTPELGFSLTMGHLNNPWGLPNGFSLPIIEIYLDTGEEGLEALLPGSGMRLPPGRTWNYAFRMTGDSFEVFAPDNVTGEPTLITTALGAQLTVQDNTLIITTRLERPQVFSMYGMVGGYDPFRDNGWRPVLAQSSPWAFTSPVQGLPVVDVIADTAELQEQAIRLGILPEMRSSAQNSRWLLVAGLGALLGLIGVAGRLMVKPTRPDDHAQTELEPEGPAVLEGSGGMAGALEAEHVLEEDVGQPVLLALPPPSPPADVSKQVAEQVIGRNGRGTPWTPRATVEARPEGTAVVAEHALPETPLPEESLSEESLSEELLFREPSSEDALAEVPGGAGVEESAREEQVAQGEVQTGVGHEHAARGPRDRFVDAAPELDFDVDAPDPLEQGWDFWKVTGSDVDEEENEKTRGS
jgi:hypothetical protein